MFRNKNIVLTGMPGVGKSSAGVLLAKQVGYSFLDTDLYLQSHEGMHLHEIIKSKGISAFREIEERYVLSVSCNAHVIATGGSVIYSEKAIRHLGSTGILVFLDLDLERLKKRFSNMDSRGVIRRPGQSIEALYEKRQPLYLTFSDITVDCNGLTPDEVVKKITQLLSVSITATPRK